MVINTFKSKDEYMGNMFGLPQEIFVKNYLMVFDRFDIIQLGLNSLIVTLSAIVLSLLFTSMAAFGFAKFRFKGNSMLFTLVIGCMMIPGQVLMIPVYKIMADLHLINNYLSLVLFYVATSIPFATFLLSANCRSIPYELLEAAKMDGANHFRIYRSIILPLLKPSLITLAILNFLSFWNELLYSMLFLQKGSMQTMTVAVATLMGRNTFNMPLLMTGLLINCIPVILIFIVFQRYIQKGITVGAVK
jgi:raffinose/stachyose/melibiose transport system permease protein